MKVLHLNVALIVLPDSEQHTVLQPPFFQKVEKVLAPAKSLVLESSDEAQAIVTPNKGKKPIFDPTVFLARIGRGRRIVDVPKPGGYKVLMTPRCFHRGVLN